ncbi:MAG: ABC transporter ATP-binding protein [Marinilabiliaceae bacterium]|nr:ABC transporter ATP-binding protein [Marinilabiliaceae bacterium]
MELQIKNLSKIYPGGKKALNEVSMTIHDGMFGLLGPNGAGKSTLMKILVTLLKPSSGDIFVNGQQLSDHRKEVRSLIGYLPQDFRFFPKLKTWEFLDYAASLAGVSSKKERSLMVDKMLEEVALYDFRNRFANKLSGGMKRRLGIAQALIGNPKIIVVDEPTTGLDPEERIRFRNILSRLTKNEVIVVLSTHIVGDISSSCNQMALINSGELQFLGTPSDFVGKADGHVWSIDVAFDELQNVKEQYHVITSIPNVDSYTLEVLTIGENGLAKYNPKPVAPNLEHAYVYFMESQNFVIQE